MYAAERLESECRELCNKVCPEAKVRLEKPPKGIEADMAIPCFGLGKNPVETAKEISEKINRQITLPKKTLISKTEPVGPYVNFYANDRFLKEAISEILKMKKNYGSEKKKKDTIIIDFSSPNIAKPLNIGHLRSTIIGQSLYNIYNFLGFRCIGDNHLGDWGTQFGKMIAAYRLWGNEKQLESGSVKYLVELYVRFHEEEEKNPSLAEEGRKWFRKLEEGDKEARRLWKKFYEISMQEFDKIYGELRVKFDLQLGESFYYKDGLKIVKEALTKNIAEKSEGAVIIKLDDASLPPLVIQKSDEATLYSTRDLACIKYRLKKFRPQKILYVIGADQKLYLRQLFAAARKLGFKTDFIHVDFGMMKLAGEKMSTRGGRFIYAEDLIKEAVERAEKIIEEKNPSLANRDKIARQVGVGAVIFNDLRQDRVKDIEFDWDKVLNLEGDSCPYLQYAYVRANSILEKSGKKLEKKFSFNEKEEVMLAKKLAEFPFVVKNSASQYRPIIIAQYLLEAASAFSDFYSKCKVIGSQNESSRIALVMATKTVISNGLRLLNIETPEKM